MEWGNSAVAVILTLFMMMVLVVYAVLYLLFSRLEVTRTWMKSLREKGTGNRVWMHVLLFLTALGITLGIITVVNFLNNQN